MSGMGKQTAHNSWLPNRLQFIPRWINSVKNCTFHILANMICIKPASSIMLQHHQIAGNSLQFLLPRLLSKEVTGHGNSVGYGNNARNWTIRSQAPNIQMSWIMEKVQRVDGDGDRSTDNADDVLKVYSNSLRKQGDFIRVSPIPISLVCNLSFKNRKTIEKTLFLHLRICIASIPQKPTMRSSIIYSPPYGSFV